MVNFRKKSKISKSCKKVGHGWKRVLKNVLRCLKVSCEVFGVCGGVFEWWVWGVLGGEKSKKSENFRNFRKVVKWSEMHRKVI